MTRRELLRESRPKHHPRFGPSRGLGLALLCPASATLIPELTADGLISDEPGPAAEEGTMLHERTLERTELDVDDLDDEQARMVERARAFIADENEGFPVTAVERSLTLDDANGQPLLWGTADLVAVHADDRRGRVVDIKFGRRHPSETLLMAQGLAYCAMAMQEFDLDSCEFVAFHVRQGIVHRQVHHGADETRDQVKLIIDRANTEAARYIPGPEQCSVCPARGHCAAQVEASIAVAEDRSQLPTDPKALGALMIKLEWVEKASKAALEACKQRVKSGYAADGWRVQTRRGARTIQDPELLFSRLAPHIDALEFIRSGSFAMGNVRKAAGLTAAQFEELAGDALVPGEEYDAVVRDTKGGKA